MMLSDPHVTSPYLVKGCLTHRGNSCPEFLSEEGIFLDIKNFDSCFYPCKLKGGRVNQAHLSKATAKGCEIMSYIALKSSS